MSARLRPVVAGLAALAAIFVGGSWQGAAPAQAAAVEVQTVPPVPGLQFLNRGRPVRADANGREIGRAHV